NQQAASMKLIQSLLALAIVISFGGHALADETGDLKITFKLRGQAPKPKPIALNGPFCGNFKHMEESLVVDPATKGIKDVVVYVYTGRRGTELKEQEPRKKTVTLENKNCRFEPHVVLLQTQDTLKVTNPDPVGHNVNLPFFAGAPVNVQIPPGQSRDFLLGVPQPAVIPAVCNSHPWMTAHVLVVDHPFFGKSDKDGVLEIKGLPAGEEIVFRAWHEQLTFKNQIFIDGKEDQWKSNKFEVKIKPGANDLGVVEVP
ncbi:MAG: methylamine utilization protein, partial [Pirellulaceae bacterium]